MSTADDIARLETQVATLTAAVYDLTRAVDRHTAAQSATCAANVGRVDRMEQILEGDGNGNPGVVRRQDALMAWRARITWWQATLTIGVVGVMARVFGAAILAGLGQ